jgi:hypothetical protein
MECLVVKGRARFQVFALMKGRLSDSERAVCVACAVCLLDLHPCPPCSGAVL